MHTSLLNIPLKDKTVPSEVHLVRHDLAHAYLQHYLMMRDHPFI